MVFTSIIKSIGSFFVSKTSLFKYLGIGLLVTAVAYLGYDYANTKSKNEILEKKVKKKDAVIKRQKKDHIKELEIVSDIVAEQERQKIELKHYNEKLLKQREVKSNVKKDDSFKSRRIIEFNF
jgi:ABC-type anion transport system duplicated permease subunit